MACRPSQPAARHWRGLAGRFLRDLRERFAEFNLELHPDKTRLIEFGRFAAPNRKKGRHSMRGRVVGVDDEQPLSASRALVLHSGLMTHVE
jgi:hypothetical protein